MVTIQGKSVYRDIGMGKLCFLENRRSVECRWTEDVEKELARFEEAVDTVTKRLRQLYEGSVRAVGETNASVFRVQELLLQDREYAGAIRQMVSDQKVNAEYAVAAAGENAARALDLVEDAYIRERAGDVRDVTNLLLEALGSAPDGLEMLQEPYLLAAEDLLPSQAVQLSAGNVRGIALKGGSTRSHAAILARSMGIPAVMKLGEAFGSEFHGKQAVIDGFTGTIYIDPDQKTQEAMEEKKREADRHKVLLRRLKGRETVSGTGRRIRLCANAGNLAEVEAAWDNDAEGIGLFRSELMYLECGRMPDEDTQFALYRRILETMRGRETVIRTFDIGADKQVPWLKQEKEENPALGMRGIRLLRENPQMFRVQLRALYRAGVAGNLRILYPMITSLEEIRSIRQMERQVRQELDREGVRYRDKVPAGIMIETPAAALLSDRLAQETDFFSVGTNDLTQYTLALDRQNAKLESLEDPGHEAVLRLIEMTAKNAGNAGIPIAICGDLAADASLSERFLSMGIDALSVPPGMILELRETIREL